MMKELCLKKRAICALVSAMMIAPMALADVVIDATNFPDETFRNYLMTGTKWKDGVQVKIDENGDGTLSDEEISTVGGIYLQNNKNVKSLKGIENFKNVWQVSVYNDDIEELDLSALTCLVNVECYGNTNLKTLKLPTAAKITFLQCGNTAIESLDVSNYNTMNVLSLANCPKLQTIALPTNNRVLNILAISGTQLATIDVSGLIGLTTLDISNNKLTTIDVASNSKLTTLNCSGNPFPSFNFSSNTVKTLVLSNTELTTLDVTGFTKLTDLDISYNKLTSFEAPKNVVQKIQCQGNAFTRLDISDYTALKYLDCSKNLFGAAGMDFSSANVKTLEQVKCSDCGLTAVDVSNLDNLRVLHVNDNYLTDIDVSANTELIELQYRNNYILAIDLSHNSKIQNYNVSYDPTGNARTINVDYMYTEDGENVYYIDLTGNELNPGSDKCELVEKLQPSIFELEKVSSWTRSTVVNSPYANTPILKLEGKPGYVDYYYSTGYNGGISTTAAQTKFRLNLTYNDVKTAISNVDADGVKVRVANGAICVDGAADGVNVYSMDGRQVYAGTDSEIAVANGMYIVKASNHVEKVIVK